MTYEPSATHINGIALPPTAANIGTIANAMSPRWTDDTTPRTDRPVRFMRADLKYGRQSHTWRWQPFGSTVSAIIPRIA